MQDAPDQERSIALATEVLEIAQQFRQVPSVQRYAKKALQVLQANGVDIDALDAVMWRNPKTSEVFKTSEV